MLVVPISRVDHDVGIFDEASEEDIFQISCFTGLKIKANTCSRALDYLAHRVARAPGDLRSHVQRINEHLKQQDAAGVYGALLDLFIALNDKGLALRKRMLNSARPALKPPLHKALLAVVEQGIDATEMMPLSRASVLSKGFTGNNQLVRRAESPETVARDPLQEAREHIEYGQIELAIELLEQAALKDPGRVELQYDLLEIYERTRDKEGFTKMHQSLGEKNAPAKDAWASLETALEKDG
jgi:Tfp pilus assembly protein FimV